MNLCNNTGINVYINRYIPTYDQVDKIIFKVCLAYGVTRDDLISNSRRGEYITPRHIAIYLIKKHTNLKLREIGSRFGNRDHSTILNAVQKVTDYSESYEDYRKDLEKIEKTI